VRVVAQRLLIALLLTLFACAPPDAPVTASRPVIHQRIVTLAPNLTELVFAAGAGELLVGVSAYSDYPPEVSKLPVVGDAFAIDQERLALLKPDLLLAWRSGTPPHVVDELRRAGYRVEVIRTSVLADIPAALTHIGSLTGRDEQAGRVAEEFDAAIAALREQFGRREPLRVFYQVSKRPLYTVSGSHYVSELIVACGGRNIFADLNELAPAIDVEAVLDRDPEVILASGDDGIDAFADWSRWPDIAANRLRNRYLMPGDEISRPTPRVLVAGNAICEALQTSRDKRRASEVSGGT
jgi:iron complex transport system substrate-binding protein